MTKRLLRVAWKVLRDGLILLTIVAGFLAGVWFGVGFTEPWLSKHPNLFLGALVTGMALCGIVAVCKYTVHTWRTTS